MNKRLVVMMIAVLVASNHQVNAQSDSNSSEEQISTKPVKLTYVEDLESKKGVADAELYLAYVNPTTEISTIKREITDSEGSVNFDIPIDDDGNTWLFRFGLIPENDSSIMLLLQMENTPVIRAPKSTENIEIILDGKGNILTSFIIEQDNKE